MTKIKTNKVTGLTKDIVEDLFSFLIDIFKNNISNKYINNEIVDIRDFGAVADGKTDCGESIRNAINEAKNKKKKLFIPHGEFLFSGELNFGSLNVYGVDNYNSILKALTDDSVIKYSSFADISNLYIDGNNIAYFGIFGNAGQKQILTNVKVRNCTNGGIVTSGVQNATFLNCNAQFNLRNFLIINNTRNVKFINCNGSVNFPNSGWKEDLKCRNIYIGHISEDPHLGSNLSKTSGVSNIGFYGGIFERTLNAECNIEIQNAEERIFFSDVEIQGTTENGALIKNDGAATVIFDKCSILGPHNLDSIRSSKGNIVVLNCTMSRGMVRKYNGIVLTGGRCNLVNNPVLIDDNFLQDISGWKVNGSGSIEHKEDRYITIGAYPSNHGAKSCPYGYSIDAGRIVKVSLYIDNKSNESAKIQVMSSLPVSPWTRAVSEIVNDGYNEIYFKATGDEVGIVLSSNVACNFNLHYIKVTVL